MKRCTTCNRTFTDPNLRFCIEDGTPLTDVEPEPEDATTVVSPRSQDDSWNATAYQPPRSYVPSPGIERKRRRAWPWLVGIAGAFMLGILVIAIAAAMLVPRIARRVEHAQSSVNRPTENSNTAPPANTNSNTNSNAIENVDAAAPTNQEQVLAQLKDIENEWTVANLNADKKKLDRILADDFVGEGPDGQPQSKSEYIRTIQRDTQIEKWDFSNLKLALTGDRATLTGTITFFAGDKKAAFDFTDKFVWRDGRWQSTGSVVKPLSDAGVDL
jgi:Domain of unknown function (DUF4440)